MVGLSHHTPVSVKPRASCLFRLRAPAQSLYILSCAAAPAVCRFRVAFGCPQPAQERAFDGSRGFLGRGHSLLLVQAIARNSLAMAFWAALHIAADDMELALNYATVLARLNVSAPISVGFVAVSNPLKALSANLVMSRPNDRRSRTVRPCVHTRDPIVEKIGSRHRIRSRYLRLWLATRHQLAPELIPLLRPEGVYTAALRTVCTQLPEDLEKLRCP